MEERSERGIEREREKKRKPFDCKLSITFCGDNAK